MTTINDIKTDLVAWEQSNYDHAILDALQKETTPALRTKYKQLKGLDKDNSKYKNIAPTTLIMFKKAVCHELRQRAWYWPLIKLLIPLANWYLITFRNKYLTQQYWGFKTEDGILKKKWWQEGLSIMLNPVIRFTKKNWYELIMVLLAIITAIITLFTLFKK